MHKSKGQAIKEERPETTTPKLDITERHQGFNKPHVVTTRVTVNFRRFLEEASLAVKFGICLVGKQYREYYT